MLRSTAESTVRRSVGWFLNSGIMRPADGFWGVAERIVVMRNNAASVAINRLFPAQTPVAPGILVLEHRRPDCNLQAALLFDLAAEVLGEPPLRNVADHLIDYLLCRSCLRDADPKSPTCGLWGWANPMHRHVYWADDNAWVAVIALVLARRGRPGLKDVGIAAARALQRQALPFLRELAETGNAVSAEKRPVMGIRMNPHWLGLVTMALAHAAAVDKETDYRNVVRLYHDLVPAGPRTTGRESGASPSGPGWSLSEHAYLALTASVAARQFDDDTMRAVARDSADCLVRNQSQEGHFRSEHDEAPAGAHLADMIYTQNWATLGLQHAAALLGSPEYRQAAIRSLEFLSRIQDASPEPWFCGCWRGSYDVQAGAWGGGDLHEGGSGSIYSGWTNAPIALAFMSDMNGASLFAL